MLNRFIDLFAGIGGFRLALESAGMECVFSSEWDRFAAQTYAANHGAIPAGDIRKVDAADIPDFEILTAGFPCQAFSISGVSKRNSLGRAHGFLDDTQGTLFFEVARILRERRPRGFILENVKNLIHHDRGRTFATIRHVLEAQLGYHIRFQVIDAIDYVPQHRERIFIVGFRDVMDSARFAFPRPPAGPRPQLREILESAVEDRYTLGDGTWSFLQKHKATHAKAGNGFGYGIADPYGATRTLSARYHKDGSEALVAQPGRNPRKLTPRECARLMGYPDSFVIPVSNTQAYMQFGNSVVVPVVAAIARGLANAMAEPLIAATA